LQPPFIATRAESELEWFQALIAPMTFTLTQSLEEPMKRSATLFLMGMMIALSACHSARHGSDLAYSANQSAPAVPSAGPANVEGTLSARPLGAAKSAESSGFPNQPRTEQEVSLNSAGVAQAVERKIIRNAEMTIETDTPNESQRLIGSIAEKHGGFVVISESKQNEAVSQSVASTVVNMVVRVPAQKFEATMEEIRGVGGHILHEKRAGQDVTEEYIDLEARIRTKRALETQFMEIMKQAHKVSDALEVQTQLAEVRTEIERLEGRRRFLENQSALSTINITLHTPIPAVAAATRGFLYDLKAAFGEGVEVGTDILFGIIRFVIVMIPVTLFILTPAWFAFKWLRRRIPWPAKQVVVSMENQGD
jgi:hypothetical protein